MKRTKDLKIILITIFIINIILNFVVFSNAADEDGTNDDTLTIPVDSEESPAPEITAGAAILLDNASGKILYSKNENQKMYPASTTKIMTAILTLENCKVNDVVTVPYEAISIVPSGYAIAALQSGEQLTVDQLLQLLMVHSANDAANVLAYHISGSIDNFANLMNQKVQDLGLTHTHFTNPSGMQDENHYTTASDLSIIMKYCIQNPNFKRYAGLTSCTIPATNKYQERTFKTTNDLIVPNNSESQRNYYYRYAIAGKTGYTMEAKNCLVSVADKDGFELICVVLGVEPYPNNLSGKFIETRELFEYGYNNYSTKKIINNGSIATQIEVKNASDETKVLNLLTTSDISVLVNQKDFNKDYKPDIELKSNIFAPISQGQVLGKITYNIDGTDYSSELVAEHNVEVSKSSNVAVRVILIILILFVIYKLLFRKKKKRKRRR